MLAERAEVGSADAGGRNDCSGAEACVRRLPVSTCSGLGRWKRALGQRDVARGVGSHKRRSGRRQVVTYAVCPSRATYTARGRQREFDRREARDQRHRHRQRARHRLQRAQLDVGSRCCRRSRPFCEVTIPCRTAGAAETPSAHAVRQPRPYVPEQLPSRRVGEYTTPAELRPTITRS